MWIFTMIIAYRVEQNDELIETLPVGRVQTKALFERVSCDHVVSKTHGALAHVEPQTRVGSVDFGRLCQQLFH